MKAFLKSLPVLGFLLKIVGRWRWDYHCWVVDPTRRLRRIFRGRESQFVVQIGSNDGATGDPIHALLKQKATWQALLVEPVPFLFGQLKRNYSTNLNVRFDNVAVGETTGVADFYYIAAEARECLPDLPVWFDQLGSFDREHIIKHLGTAVAPFIVTEQINVLPLSELLARNRVGSIDLLHIDTEGYDWRILKQLDKNVFMPHAILFEYKHLSHSDRADALDFLKKDYRIRDLDVTGDYLCERR